MFCFCKYIGFCKRLPEIVKNSQCDLYQFPFTSNSLALSKAAFEG